MATAIKAIYRGSVTYSSADGVAPAAISIGGTIDPAKSIVSITTRDSDAQNRAYRHFFHYDITTTTIAFTRPSSAWATSVTLEWEIIEFSTGVSVQRGNANFTTGTTLDVPITAVTAGQAFATATAFSLPGSSNAVPKYYTDLTSTTNLRITQDAAINVTFSWQVVEFNTDVTIQNGLSSSTGGASKTSRTVAITAVDTTRSFILNRGHTPPPSYGPSREPQTIGFNSGTQIQIDSLNWGTIIDNTTAWTVVELPVGSVVQSGAVTVLNTATTPTAQPSWTGALANGSSLNAYAYHQNRKTQLADNTVGHYQFAVSMDVGKTSLTVQRNLSSNDHVINWFAIDWPAAGGGPLTVSMSGIYAGNFVSPVAVSSGGVVSMAGVRADNFVSGAALSASHDLVVAGIYAGNFVSPVAVSSGGLVSMAGVRADNFVSGGALSASHDLVVGGIYSGNFVSPVALSSGGVVSMAGVRADNFVSGAALSASHNIMVGGIYAGNFVSPVAVSGGDVVFMAGVRSDSFVSGTVLSARHNLVMGGVFSANYLVGISLTLVGSVTAWPDGSALLVGAEVRHLYAGDEARHIYVGAEDRHLLV